ncbi:MAG: glycosyltransferase, partial [Thomasclavelia sp.]|nr:glycosyltransferase [Thomasclavelia sp.]
MYDVSIILVNYKSKFLTENCIKSIYNSQCQLKFEIIVIDNHSEDGSVDYLRGKFPSVKVIDSKKNSGFAFANNMGVRIADGKYVLLL